MSLSKTDATSFIAMLVIIVSVAVIGLEMTGNVTDTADVNVTITSSASINFSQDVLFFGDGYVWANASGYGALLDSEGTVTNGTWSATNGGLQLNNTGNVDINVSLSSDKLAPAFIGDPAATFKYKVENGSTADCKDQQTEGTAYTEFTTSPVMVCGNVTAAQNVLDIQIELYIPASSPHSAKTAQVTATAQAI